MKQFSIRNQAWLILLSFVLITAVACGSSGESGGKETLPDPDAGITTDSGLQYIETEAGTGAQAKAGDLVAVHYVGSLPDGSEFDNSIDRGNPIEFVLGRGAVIAGWDEGIALMKEGGKATLVIPPNLGYGSRGAGNVVPPDATLIFDVELVSVQSP
jgi:peptidylprolyl isomerase